VGDGSDLITYDLLIIPCIRGAEQEGAKKIAAFVLESGKGCLG
jgi:hypothetical protein